MTLALRRRILASLAAPVVVVAAAAVVVAGLLTAPAGAAPTAKGWSRPERVSTSALYSVSCPSAHFCAAVGAGGTVLTFDGRSWHVAAQFPAAGRLWSVDCPTTQRCVAVGEHGSVTFFDGTRWTKPVDDDPGRVLSAVGCWSSTECLVGESSSLVFTLSRTAVGKPKFVDQYATYFTAYTAVSCAPRRRGLCAFVDSSGSMLVWRRGTWINTRLATDPPVVSILARDALSSVSCASASDCVAVTDGGGVVSWNGSGWSAPQSFDPHGLVSAAIACPTVTHCLIVDDAGEAYGYTPSNHYGGAPGFFTAPTATGLPESLPVAMSCPTASLCVVVTGGGEATVWHGSVRD